MHRAVIYANQSYARQARRALRALGTPATSAGAQWDTLSEGREAVTKPTLLLGSLASDILGVEQYFDAPLLPSG